MSSVPIGRPTENATRIQILCTKLVHLLVEFADNKQPATVSRVQQNLFFRGGNLERDFYFKRSQSTINIAFLVGTIWQFGVKMQLFAS